MSGRSRAHEIGLRVDKYRGNERQAHMIPNISVPRTVQTIAASAAIRLSRLQESTGVHMFGRHPADIMSIGIHAAIKEPQLREMLKRLNQDDAKDVFIQIATDVTWAQNGLPAFELTHSLASALLLTDSSDVALSELHWPFKTFAIIPPSGMFQVGSDANKDVILITCFEFEEYTEVSHLADAINVIKRNILDPNDPSLVADMRRIYAYPTNTLHMVRMGNGAGMSLESRHAVSGNTIKEYLGEDMSWQDGVTETDIHAADAAFRMAVNLSLYIATLPPEQRPDIAPIRVDSRGETRARVYKMGSEVKLPRQLRDAAKAYAKTGRAGTEDSTNWRIHRRHVVRGHWRNQACGPKLSEHKRIWIMPHWKGPETAEAMMRLYAVDQVGGR